MPLRRYHTEQDHHIHITRQQASAFAKEIAGDFNPIHNVDAKRFCVPGDLLFALVLQHYGVSNRMQFHFEGMVGEDTELCLPPSDDAELVIRDTTGKAYLKVERSGDTSRDPQLVEQLTHGYVAFSGRTFPHILVPLMEAHQVMINTERPLVIYESMAIRLDRLQAADLQLQLGDAHLAVDGKRGDVRLEFDLICDGEKAGSGEKTMVMSGLRPYQADRMQALVEEYQARKAAYVPGSI